MRIENVYGEEENYSYFLIKDNIGIRAKVLIDKEDVEKCKRYKWKLSYYGYVINSFHKLRIHRYIMGLGSYEIDKRVVDHIFHNKHDNRKSQLKICTLSENSNNKLKRSDGIYTYKPGYM